MKVTLGAACIALFLLLGSAAFAVDHTKQLGLEATLSTADAYADLARSVAISGNVIVSVENGDGITVDVYVGSNGRWNSGTPTAQLTAADAGGFNSVAISGNTIVAGSLGGDGGIGAAYIFVEPAGGWTNMTATAELTAKGAKRNNLVGCSVGISGDTVVVGASETNMVGDAGSGLPTFATGPGVALVYEKPSTGWANMTQTATLYASDGQSGDDLGYSVGIAGNTIVAGAPNAEAGNGAVYVFHKSGTQWKAGTQTAKLIASDGKNQEALGTGVGISANTIAACSFTAAYVFVEPDAGWTNGTQTAELTGTGNQSNGLYSIAISDHYVLVGLPSGGYPFGSHQTAMGFIKPATGWSNMTVPTNIIRKPAGDPAGAGFGYAVAIGESALVIGSPLLGGDVPFDDYVYVFGLI